MIFLVEIVEVRLLWHSRFIDEAQCLKNTYYRSIVSALEIQSFQKPVSEAVGRLSFSNRPQDLRQILDLSKVRFDRAILLFVFGCRNIWIVRLVESNAIVSDELGVLFRRQRQTRRGDFRAGFFFGGAGEV